MKPNKTSIYKHILIYGLIYGFLWGLKSTVAYLIFNHPGSRNKLNITLELFLIIGFMPYAIYIFKKNNNGYLKFKEAVTIGFCFSIFAFLTTTIWYLFYKNIITPEYLNNTLERSRESNMLNNPELLPKEINQITSTTTSNLLNIKNLYELLLYIAIGFCVSSIAGAFMYKKKKM
ncbi:DUF4199 domain-containing protein [Aquimarina acroporae]|uniref:DUF4199 domain-containing protein n=1 Tax=Aquimarina acroporae TaxID=2937283 RepID=UPI00374CC162